MHIGYEVNFVVVSVMSCYCLRLDDLLRELISRRPPHQVKHNKVLIRLLIKTHINNLIFLC
jgi:hypothetical protein